MNSFLMAAYDENSKEFVGVCKLGTGFSEDDLMEIQKRMSSQLLPSMPDNYSIPNNLRPGVVFKPKEVWEVGFDTLTVSPNYSIGKGIIDNISGLSLRFPRFLRFRPDKKVEQATNTESILELYSEKLLFSEKMKF
jgi:DNA ligase-1